MIKVVNWYTCLRYIFIFHLSFMRGMLCLPIFRLLERNGCKQYFVKRWILLQEAIATTTDVNEVICSEKWSDRWRRDRLSAYLPQGPQALARRTQYINGYHWLLFFITVYLLCVEHLTRCMGVNMEYQECESGDQSVGHWAPETDHKDEVNRLTHGQYYVVDLTTLTQPGGGEGRCRSTVRRLCERGRNQGGPGKCSNPELSTTPSLIQLPPKTGILGKPAVFENIPLMILISGIRAIWETTTGRDPRYMRQQQIMLLLYWCC